MKIDKAEKQDIEFKQNWQDEYLKTICAFANTLGGTLYIGVKDDGQVCGVEDYKKLSETIPLKVKQCMGLLCDVSVLDTDEGRLKYLLVKVEKYGTPVSYHGKYYKRVGSTTQEVTGFALNEFILKAYGLTWDAATMPDVDAGELDERAFKVFKTWAVRNNRFRAEDLQISNKELLQNLRSYEKGNLTRGTVMAFHPDPERWVIGAYIKIGYFANDADILFQDEVHGALLTQVEDTIDIIYTKYMKALISYNDIHREELYFFPRGAFRELLLNAVIHKDYTQPYPIQIRIYSNKIDIWNIGAMPDSVRIEDLYHQHPSVPRNPKIADIFFKCGFIESWGRGYFKIQTICAENDAKLPEPTNLAAGLSVICNASEAYEKLAREYGVDYRVNDRVNDRVNETQKKIINAILKNAYITQAELAAIIGISVVHINKNMKKLQNAGLIERVGSDRRGYWRIKQSP